MKFLGLILVLNMMLSSWCGAYDRLRPEVINAYLDILAPLQKKFQSAGFAFEEMVLHALKQEFPADRYSILTGVHYGYSSTHRLAELDVVIVDRVADTVIQVLEIKSGISSGTGRDAKHQLTNLLDRLSDVPALWFQTTQVVGEPVELTRAHFAEGVWHPGIVGLRHYPNMPVARELIEHAYFTRLLDVTNDEMLEIFKLHNQSYKRRKQQLRKNNCLNAFLP